MAPRREHPARKDYITKEEVRFSDHHAYHTRIHFTCTFGDQRGGPKETAVDLGELCSCVGLSLIHSYSENPTTYLSGRVRN